MIARRRPTPKSLHTQTEELAWAVPWVVPHRMARMALAGAPPSARDRREFQLMGAEKLAVFQESWLNMSFATLRANQQIALSALHSLS